MSGSDFTFNISKAKLGYYASLPNAGDSLILVLLKSTGLEADATLKDYDTLSALLAASNDEADCTNYARKTLSTVTVTVDDTNDRVDIDSDNVTYTALGGASDNTIAKGVVCYKPSGAADSSIIPLSAHTLDFGTDGTDQTVTIANIIRVS